MAKKMQYLGHARTLKSAQKKAKEFEAKGWEVRIVGVKGHNRTRRGKTTRVRSYVRMTKRYERWQIRSPKDFIKRSFRTHDIGRKGFSKRIAGKLKSTGKWGTQSLLISKVESEPMKRQLRTSAKRSIRRL